MKQSWRIHCLCVCVCETYYCMWCSLIYFFGMSGLLDQHKRAAYEWIFIDSSFAEMWNFSFFFYINSLKVFYFSHCIIYPHFSASWFYPRAQEVMAVPPLLPLYFGTSTVITVSPLSRKLMTVSEKYTIFTTAQTSLWHLRVRGGYSRERVYVCARSHEWMRAWISEDWGHLLGFISTQKQKK